MLDKSADEEPVEQKEMPGVHKDSGSAEELVNDGQRCAVSEDTSTTDDVGQENETKSEVKRCAELQCWSHCVALCCV